MEGFKRAAFKRHHFEDSWQKRLDDGTGDTRHNHTSSENSLTINLCQVRVKWSKWITKF